MPDDALFAQLFAMQESPRSCYAAYVKGEAQDQSEANENATDQHSCTDKKRNRPFVTADGLLGTCSIGLVARSAILTKSERWQIEESRKKKKK